MQTMFRCKMSVSPPRGNFGFKFACFVVYFVIAYSKKTMKM